MLSINYTIEVFKVSKADKALIIVDFGLNYIYSEKKWGR